MEVGQNGVATVVAVGLVEEEVKSRQEDVITLHLKTMEAHVSGLILSPKHVTQKDARPQVNTTLNINFVLY